MRILEQKGYVAHEEAGRAFVYRALLARDDAAASAVGHLLSRFFENSSGSLALRLIETERPSDDELATSQGTDRAVRGGRLMNASMPQGLAHFAGAVTAIAINALWEGALLVVCIWLLLRAWPSINAATRYIVWSATLVATVVVPIATTLPFLTPSSPTAVTAAAVRVPIPMVTHALTAVPSHTLKPAARTANPAVRAGEAATVSVVPRLPERFRMTLPLPVLLAVLTIWTGLALVAFLRLGIGLFRLEQLKRDALPLPIEYRDAMARWTSARKGRRDVRLCVSDEIDVPVAVGLFDAMILIPRSLLERLSESEVDQISLHELAHLRRADDWTNGLQRVATALFGWNPAVLFVGQQLDLEREVACDDWVLVGNRARCVRTLLVWRRWRRRRRGRTVRWPRRASSRRANTSRCASSDCSARDATRPRACRSGRRR